LRSAIQVSPTDKPLQRNDRSRIYSFEQHTPSNALSHRLRQCGRRVLSQLPWLFLAARRKSISNFDSDQALLVNMLYISASPLQLAVYSDCRLC